MYLIIKCPMLTNNINKDLDLKILFFLVQQAFTFCPYFLITLYFPYWRVPLWLVNHPGLLLCYACLRAGQNPVRRRRISSFFYCFLLVWIELYNIVMLWYINGESDVHGWISQGLFQWEENIYHDHASIDWQRCLSWLHTNLHWSNDILSVCFSSPNLLHTSTTLFLIWFLTTASSLSDMMENICKMFT